MNKFSISTLVHKLRQKQKQQRKQIVNYFYTIKKIEL